MVISSVNWQPLYNLLYRSHIETEHPSGMSVCGVCGARFALPQDLGTHVRDGDCPGSSYSRKVRGEMEEVSVKVEIRELSCPEEGCGFEADTFNMLLFHQVQVSHLLGDSFFSLQVFPAAMIRSS